MSMPHALSLSLQSRNTMGNFKYTKKREFSTSVNKRDMGFAPKTVQNLQLIDTAELKKDILSKKTERLNAKLQQVSGSISDLKELNTYHVKVADSCPLAVNMKT